jgi:UDP-N-acetylmuramyl pentapeptide synthase
MLTKYRDTPKNYVDAGLILIGEKLKITEILTIDSDFSVYKFKNGNQFKNLLQEVLRKKDFLLIKQT